MALSYNPIVRTFGQVRAVLVGVLGVDRRAVCPATPLDALVPAERHAEFLGGLREAGFSVMELEGHVQEWPLCRVVPILLMAVIFVPVFLKSWLVCALSVPLFVAFCVLACVVTRTRVVEVPLGPRTVGELVIYLTRFSDHKGYRFSRNEIALKVRFVVAEWLGVPAEEIREDTSFNQLIV